MTKKFDPKTTPKTDRNKFYLSELDIEAGSKVPVVETWFAEDLEQELNITREQLRIAIKTLELARWTDDGGEAEFVTKALEEIEQVGK